MWDLVGNNFERQAVLNPASARPNAAYHIKVMYFRFFRHMAKMYEAYSEASTSGADNNCIICVINDCIVSDSFLTL